MEVRRLNREEYTEGFHLIHDSFSEKNDKLIDLMEEKSDSFEMLGCFNEKMEAVLLFEPESLAILLMAGEKENLFLLLDEISAMADNLHLGKLKANVLPRFIPALREYGFETVSDQDEAAVQMEYYLGKEYLGKTFTVIVDRPYGSFHPHIPDVLYPLNYGYVDHMMSQDGEFQDAYVYGPEEPLEKFRGTLIGIIYHKDDLRSRWIIAPMLENIRHEDVIHAIGFEEQYYDTRIIWQTDVKKA